MLQGCDAHSTLYIVRAVVVGFGWVSFALNCVLQLSSASPICWFARCVGSWVLLALFCFLRVTLYIHRDGLPVGSDQKGRSGESGAGTGESTRLKLQTPLFVADALLQAAEQQLELEHTACTQEVRAGLVHHLPDARRGAPHVQPRTKHVSLMAGLRLDAPRDAM